MKLWLAAVAYKIEIPDERTERSDDDVVKFFFSRESFPLLAVAAVRCTREKMKIGNEKEKSFSRVSLRSHARVLLCLCELERESTREINLNLIRFPRDVQIFFCC